MDGYGSSKDDKGRSVDEVKYRGVRISNKGKFEAEIRDVNRNNAEVWLGTFATAEEARAYDKVAYQMQGRMVVLNFPTEYKSTFSTVAYNASTMAATAGAVKSSSSGNVQGKEVFEIEYLDDKLLEDLLGCDDKIN